MEDVCTTLKVTNYTTSENSITDSDEEFPDLEYILTPKKNALLKENDIAYVKFKNVWWPALCKKIYTKKKKVSVTYINCEQKSSILVPFKKIKQHCEMDYCLFLSEESDLKGLKEAMLLTDLYRSNASKLNMPPDKFFSQGIGEQRQILNELLEEELKSEQGSTESIITIDIPVPVPSTPVENFESAPKRQKLNTIISEVMLSEREKTKLKSAEKARHTMNMPVLKYIRNEVCIRHLIEVSKGEFKSRRHDNFLSAIGSNQFWKLHLAENNQGFFFFNINDRAEYSNYVTYLFEKLSNKKFLSFCKNDRDRRMYVMLVLVPEAIKQGLRRKKKILNEDDLEKVLREGFRETATEKKARKLMFEEPDSDIGCDF